MRRWIPALAILLLSGAMGTHYVTLGVSNDATPAQIKAAYRKAALRSHPDKARGRGAAAREAAASQMERLNEAYGTLSDPDQRRRYDSSLFSAAPRWGSPPRWSSPQQRLHVVDVKVSCTLEQLAGFEPVRVDLHSALGLPASRRIAPLRVFLKPGSESGDTHRVPLGHLGVMVVMKLTYEVPHIRFSRLGHNLTTLIWLPAWHNSWWWQLFRRHVPLRVRTLSGRMHSVGHGVIAAHGEVQTLRELGMPIRSSDGGSAYACARGDLHVRLRMRSMKETCARALRQALGGTTCAAVVLRLAPWRGIGRRKSRKPRVSLWTGPGVGIGRPFRIPGRSGMYAYKIE